MIIIVCPIFQVAIWPWPLLWISRDLFGLKCFAAVTLIVCANTCSSRRRMTAIGVLLVAFLLSFQTLHTKTSEHSILKIHVAYLSSDAMPGEQLEYRRLWPFGQTWNIGLVAKLELQCHVCWLYVFGFTYPKWCNFFNSSIVHEHELYTSITSNGSMHQQRMIAAGGLYAGI